MLKFLFLGITASVSQVVILREFSFSIAKNELALVVAAGIWIAACAWGSIREPRAGRSTLSGPSGAVRFALLFCVCLLLIHLAKTLSGINYYEAVSLRYSLLCAFALIGPPAMAVGLLFRGYCAEYLQSHASPSPGIYSAFLAWEAAGFFLGGIAFTFLFKDYTNPFIFVLLALPLLPPGLKFRQTILPASLIILFTLACSANFTPVLSRELGGARISLNKGSGYGPLIAAERSGTQLIYSSGSLAATGEDRAGVETFIHTSLSALDSPRGSDILFIGAALSGQISEIAQYSPRSLDCVQINPAVSGMVRQDLPPGLSAVARVITADPRSWLKNTRGKYDAILVELPAPDSFSLNRYFTREFFSLAASALKNQGVFSCVIPGKREILSPQYARFDSSVTAAAEQIFPFVLLVPGDSLIILASASGRISPRKMLENFSRRNPAARFFTYYHLRDALDPGMLTYARRTLRNKSAPNTDLEPRGLLNYLLLQQAKFYPSLPALAQKLKLPALMLLLLAALAASASLRLSPKTTAASNTAAVGFLSIGLSSLVFILFQVYCGGLFWKLGLLTALFMAGTAAGVFLINSSGIKPRGKLKIIWLAWTTVLTGLFFSLPHLRSGMPAEVILGAFSLAGGLLTGSAYPVLAPLWRECGTAGQRVSPALYSADLAGAFIGTLVFGVFAIPFLGIADSILLLLAVSSLFTIANPRA